MNVKTSEIQEIKDNLGFKIFSEFLNFLHK
jgi:hypothetical protein